MEIKWNEVTWYSKLIAIIFFVMVLPTWVFYLGTRFQQIMDIQNPDQLQGWRHSKVLRNIDDCPYSTQREMINSETSYKNAMLGFVISLPRGWYLPSEDDNDPHFYTCESTGRMVDGFEIQPRSDQYDSLNAESTKHVSVITTEAWGARVFNYRDLFPEAEWGDGWAYEYVMLFDNGHKAIYFLSRKEINSYYWLKFNPIP